ncbi:MAG: sensor histidine kinase, partial [Rhodobacteraceae bacterium]
MRALPHPSLRAMAAFWIGAAFLAGVAAAWLWFGSQNAWREHLLRADRDGQLLFAAIETGAGMPKDLQAYPLTKPDADLAEKAQFISLPDAPRPALLTHIPVAGLHPSGTNMPQLVVEAISSDLSYPVGRLTTRPDMAAQEMLGQIVRLLSTYCGDPLVVLRSSGGTWYRLDGSALWSCQAAPPDRRIAAMALGGFALLALLVGASRIAHRFSDFASQLHDRQLRGGPDAYEREGPAEL